MQRAPGPDRCPPGSSDDRGGVVPTARTAWSCSVPGPAGPPRHRAGWSGHACAVSVGLVVEQGRRGPAGQRPMAPGPARRLPDHPGSGRLVDVGDGSTPGLRSRCGLVTSHGSFRLGPDPLSTKAAQLLVPRDFAVRPPRGATVRRRRDLDSQVDPLWWPWVTSAEDTILDLAETDRHRQPSRCSVGHSNVKRTSESVLLSRLADRSRHARRDLLREVLGDVASGAESTMEVRYLRDVERAHGFRAVSVRYPRRRPRRRGTTSGTATNAFSSSSTASSATKAVAARIRDGRRDRRGATTGWLTALAFWPDVLDPCALAKEVGAILQTRGWSGRPRHCRRRPCLVRGAGPGR